MLRPRLSVGLRHPLPRRRLPHDAEHRRRPLLLSEIARAAGAEFIGTAALVVVILGAVALGIHVTEAPWLRALIAGGIIAAGLGVLIALLLPLSGAQFNPVVTLAVAAVTGRWDVLRIVAVIAAQLLGGALAATASFILFPDLRARP